MRRLWIVWPVTMALLLAACADSADPGAGEEPAPEQPTGEAEADDGTNGEEDDDLGIIPTLRVGETDFGTALVDPDGRSLYLFENDQDGASTCDDDCADSWPPLTTAIAPFSHEADVAELLGTHTREDGASQVTYNGWPLYYFSGDGDPGDTSGQGTGDVWWLVSPAGEPIRETGS